MIDKLTNWLLERFQRVTKILLIILAIAMASSTVRSFLRIDKAGGRVGDAQKRVDELKRQNQDLQERLNEAQSEEYVEKQLRDKLGLAREGEIVVVLPEDDVVRKFAPRLEEEEEVLPDPNWIKWAKTFGFEI